MGLNYGIGFCKRGIKVLEDAEEKMFDTLGHGYDKFSQANMQLMKYRRMLAQFTRERDAGMRPSYDPDIHGSFDG